MNEYEIVDLILKYDNKIIRHYKQFILQNFKCNSKSTGILSERQYFILYIIIYKKINTITEIASFLHLSKANISILIKKLEENNFVVKEKESTFDSRVTKLFATEEGKKVFTDTRSQVSSIIKDTIIVHVVNNDDFESTLIYLKSTFNIDDKINEPEDILLLFFISIYQIISELYNNFLAEKNYPLSVAELKIFTTIAFFDNINFEGLTQSMGLSYSTLSLQVKKLEQSGYIIKHKDVADARITYLTLSPESQVIVKNLSEYKARRVREHIQGKDDVELRSTIKFLVDVTKFLDAIEEVSMQRISSN